MTASVTLRADDRDDLAKAAIANLIGTYTALGLAVPESYPFSGDGYAGVLSPAPHGVANFAVLHRPTPEAARELAGLAAESPAFCLYLISDPERDPGIARRAAEIVRRAGFADPTPQAVMTRLPHAVAPSESNVTEVGPEIGARDELTRLLARVFFEFAPEPFRDVLARATARAEGGRLFAWREGDEIIGGAMAHPAAEAWGLYDIAVTEPWRRRGIGARLVRAVAAEAPDGAPISLQCHRPLQAWYERLGFVAVAQMTTLHPARRVRL